MESMEQKTQLVDVVLFTDQIRWMNKRVFNLDEFVQGSLDEMMCEDKEVYKEVVKRRRENMIKRTGKDIKRGDKNGN